MPERQSQSRQILGALRAKRKELLLCLIFILALSLRLAGLNWGIPIYDAETARAAANIRTSYHLDEGTFLWNLARIRPRTFDFYVADFHWGTLQYYLIEAALLICQALGVVSTPWRRSFFDFHPDQFGRLFEAGRAVSAILGSCSIFPAYGIARRLWDEQSGIWASLVLALCPLHAINSHYLTSDISMAFFLLLAFYGLVTTFEKPNRSLFFTAGIAVGLAVAAKYNAVFLLPVIILSHFLQAERFWSKKWLIYPGAVAGFVAGEPYALVHHSEFWGSLQRNYLSTVNLPEGVVPSWPALLVLQLKNAALFGMGLPLALVLIVGGCGYLWSRFRMRGGLFPQHSLSRRGQLQSRDALSSSIRGAKIPVRILLYLCILLFSISALLLRQPMLRYTIPALVFAVILDGHLLRVFAQQRWGRTLAFGVILATGAFTLLQIKILIQEHTANQAFEWIEGNVPSGASLTKGWPQLPALNPEKYKIRNYYTQNRLVDFKDFFLDDRGQTFFPDYVLLDNLPIFDFPAEFLQTLGRHYWLAAEFKRNPQFWNFTFPEWNAPHDWKYSHPEIRIYRKKAKL